MKYPVKEEIVEKSEKELRREEFQEKLDEIVEVAITYLMIGVLASIPILGVIGLFGIAFGILK